LMPCFARSAERVMPIIDAPIIRTGVDSIGIPLVNSVIAAVVMI